MRKLGAPARPLRTTVRILVYVGSDIMQRIFSSATRRELLGKHLKGGRRGGELKIDWTKPPD